MPAVAGHPRDRSPVRLPDRFRAGTPRQFMPWAVIGAGCLGSFAATSSGTTRAPFLLEMSHDLHVGMPLVANLVSMTATAWGITSALAGYLSDRFGRRPLLIAAPFALALAMIAQAFSAEFAG